MSATTTLAGPPQPSAKPSRRHGPGYVLGEVLITIGLVVLLFVFYQVYMTDWFSAGKQTDATRTLDAEWTNPRADHVDLVDGHGIAKMYIPALGADYHFTIIQGTSDRDLAIGPGHYVLSAMPGEPGNFAVAGHRVGKGAPFNDINLIQPCDAIVVETADNWFVYRMLPEKEQATTWVATHGTDLRCRGIAPLGGSAAPEYADTVGQEIVPPQESSVIAAVPHHPESTLSKGQRIPLMTLTTCNPRFSDRQRLIVHAILVRAMTKNPKKPNQTPPELTETS